MTHKVNNAYHWRLVGPVDFSSSVGNLLLREIVHRIPELPYTDW